VKVWLHTFLTSALDGDEWSASHPGHFSHEGKRRAPPPVLRAGLDMMVKRKNTIIVPAGKQTLVIQPVG